jgi:hypothetical protein
MKQEIKKQIELLELCLEEYTFPEKETEAGELTINSTNLRKDLSNSSEDFKGLNRAIVRLSTKRQLSKVTMNREVA